MTGANLRALIASDDYAVVRQGVAMACGLGVPLEPLLATRRWNAFDLLALAGHPALVSWAVACARRVLIVYEERYPGDRRPHRAIEAMEGWAAGAVGLEGVLEAAAAVYEASTRDDNDAHYAASAAYVLACSASDVGDDAAIGASASASYAAHARAAVAEDDAERQAQQALLRERLLAAFAAEGRQPD